MRFASLGSGSSGNAALVEVRQGIGKTCIMLDCGFSIKQTQIRLERLGCCPEKLSAVVLTHEHADHIGSALAFCKKFKIKLVMSWGTAMAARILDYALKAEVDLKIIEPGLSFELDSIDISPFTVPHDAREPIQCVFSDGAHRLGMLTDVGHITPNIELILQNCDGLVLECNHDKLMLANGRYPANLKARIGGNYGHLANCQAANLLSKIYSQKLKYVVAAHLSEENNCPELVRRALSDVLNTRSSEILLATQSNGIDWLSL